MRSSHDNKRRKKAVTDMRGGRREGGKGGGGGMGRTDGWGESVRTDRGCAAGLTKARAARFSKFRSNGRGGASVCQ
jgi:hypothetical protein